MVDGWRDGARSTGAPGEGHRRPDVSHQIVGIDRDPDGVLIREEAQVELRDRGGQTVRRWRTRGEVAVMARRGDALITGRLDGRVTLGQDRELQVASASPVLRLALGPAGTIAVGRLDGAVELYDLATGRPMDAASLTGAVTHLELVGHRLFAVSESGDALSWDLSVLESSRCDLIIRHRESVEVGHLVRARSSSRRQLPRHRVQQVIRDAH